MANPEVSVKIVCESCGATGLVSGELEPKGVGVVCFRCKGSGAQTLSYAPFTERQRRRGVKFVQVSPVYLSGGCRSSRISYAQFLKGEAPKVISPVARKKKKKK